MLHFAIWFSFLVVILFEVWNMGFGFVDMPSCRHSFDCLLGYIIVGPTLRFIQAPVLLPDSSLLTLPSRWPAQRSSPTIRMLFSSPLTPKRRSSLPLMEMGLRILMPLSTLTTVPLLKSCRPSVMLVDTTAVRLSSWTRLPWLFTRAPTLLSVHFCYF